MTRCTFFAGANRGVVKTTVGPGLTASFVVLAVIALALPLRAVEAGTIRVRVIDPLGAVVTDATVKLFRRGKPVGSSRTDREGFVHFSSVEPGRYRIEADAPGFGMQARPVLLTPGAEAAVQLLLPIGTLEQQITVSASAAELPEAQVGASVEVIDRAQLDRLGKFHLAEALRLVPGVQVVQTGRGGGTTSLFVRGGNSNFNKALLDGIPLNDAGGDFEIAGFSSDAVDRVEVLRGPNSVLYGSDALGSVINIETRRGASAIPRLTYAGDAGNFRSFHQEASIAGAFRRFDYFSDFSRFDTRNGLPNDSFHNGTYAGNFGFAWTQTTDLRLTIRHTAVALGLPNALDFYGVADDSAQKERRTAAGVTFRNQTTARWHNLVRLASSVHLYAFANPSPSGTPFDPFNFGPNYLGNTVTIRGGNGFTASGRAILDLGGPYPQLFNARTRRQSVYAQSDYLASPHAHISAGFRYESERGFTDPGGSRSPLERDNFSSFLEGRADLGRRMFVTAGAGLENNAVFGFAATPRASLAYYLRRPSAFRQWSDTRVRFNFGKGITEPSVLHEGSSLFRVLSGLPGGSALISRFSVQPIGPERSRSLDLGVDQGLWGNRARFGVTLFHNRFFDLIDFVSNSVLPQLGVPSDVAQATPYGATVNSASYRARGAEVDVEARLRRGWGFRGAYTYLDAVVTRSFASSALEPAFNPAFPGIPIGVFSPLVGGRPFLRAPHSGSLMVHYAHPRFGFSVSGYFVGKQDGSTFLSDAFFGNSMLLPNRNLNPGHQKVDCNFWYEMHPRVRLYTNAENVLSRHYQAALGFPALPLVFRTGLRLTLGGDR